MRIGVRREISGGNGPIGRDGRLRLVPIIISSFILLTDFSSLDYIGFYFWRSFVGFIYFYLRDTFGVSFWFDFYTPVSNDSWHILIVFCMGSIVRDFLFWKGYELCYYSAYGGAFHFYLLCQQDLLAVFCLFHSASVFKGVFFWCCSSEWA